MKTKKYPYIKPTRYKHDSGFRCFEVGYILKMTKDNKVAKKEVIGNCADHIYQDYLMAIGERKPFSINMDLTVDGYIRFFSLDDRELVWKDNICYSSMQLVSKFLEEEK